MKKLIYLLGLIFVLITPQFTYAQIQIDTLQTVETLIQKVLIGNNDVKIANIKFKGSKKALGVFNVDTTKNKFAITKGLILSTGNATSANGPNKSPGTSDQMMRRGDKDLDKLSGSVTYDAIVIEFDFIPMQNKISFRYIFASEEYVEFTNSTYNDVFGFFITGPEMENGKNLAIIPGSRDIVSVNSVNQYKNRHYFYDNNIWQISGKQLPEKDRDHLSKNLIQTIEFDGLTTVLTAQTNVVPFKKYHLKLAISDVTDMVYNSAVFLEGGSFASLMDTTADERFLLAGEVDVDKVNFDAIFKGKETKIVFSDTPAPKKIVTTVKKPKEVPKEYEAPMTVAKKEKPAPVSTPVTPSTSFTIGSDKNRSTLIRTFNSIHFDNSSFLLEKQNTAILADVHKQMLENDNSFVYLYGHTDADGSENDNMHLSEKRTKEVRDYLIGKGISADRIFSYHYGERQPIAENTTSDGKSQNRRVEIFLRQQPK